MLERLLAQYRSDGDASAMQELVDRTRGRLLAVARRIGQPQDAEDTVQAAYHSLLRRSEPLDAPVLPWLVTTVVRIAYRNKAAVKKQRELAERLARDRGTTGVAWPAQDEERIEVLREAVAALPPKYRDVVVLHHLEGLTVAETARLLELRPNTAKIRLQRARALLRGRLGPRMKAFACAPLWMVADAARGIGALVVVGGVMKGSAVAVAAVAIVVVGVLAIGSKDDGRTRSVPTETLTMRNRPGVAEPKPEPGVERGPSRSPESGPGLRKSGAGTTDEVVPTPKAMELVRAYWKHHLVAYAPTTEYQVGERHAAAAAVARESLIKRGPDGFRAVVALLREGKWGPWADAVAKATFEPGCEVHLLNAAEDPALSPMSRTQVLRYLGLADTAKVRRYLLDLLEKTKDRSVFWGAADALGKLKEPRAAVFLGDKLRRPGWAGLRPSLVQALAGMGGPDARRILLDELGKHGADKYGIIGALESVDPELAAEQATILLEESGNGMAPGVKSILERIRDRR